MSETDRRPSLRVGPLVIDSHLREVRKAGVDIGLSPTEFGVFFELAMRKGKVVLREEFEQWKNTVDMRERHPVDDVIVGLKRALGKDVLIKSERGRGYRISENIPVTEISTPSVQEAEKLKEIALDRMKMHTRESIRTSIQAYENSLKEAPDADAYAKLAMAYFNECHVGICLDLPQRSIPRIRELLERAFSDYPDFSSAYALRALSYLIFEYDWKKAEEDLRRAFSANADDEYAHLFAAHMEVARRNFEVGLAHASRAAELDWRRPMSGFTLPWMLVFANRADQALIECERLLRMFDPFAVGHLISGYAWWAAGANTRAIAEYERSLELSVVPSALAALGHIHGSQKDLNKAKQCLDELRALVAKKKTAYVSGYHEALIYVGMEEHQAALGCLERSFQERCNWLIYLDVDSRWAPLQNDRHFLTLRDKVGLSKVGGHARD